MLEAVFYIFRAFSYVGKEDQKGGLREHVKLSLMEAYKSCGIKITTNNFLRFWILLESYLRETLQSSALSGLITVKFCVRFSLKIIRHGTLQNSFLHNHRKI